MSYASQATVEEILKRPLSSSEAALFPLIADAIEDFFNDALDGVGFGDPDPSTRYYDADGRTKFLEIDPVYQDKTVLPAIDFVVNRVDNEGNPVATVDPSTFASRPRNEKVKTYLQLRSGVWPRGVANIAVVGKFTRGLTVPSDVEYAANYLAAQYLVGTSEESLSLESESIEGYSRKFATIAKENPVILRVLDKYKDIML